MSGPSADLSVDPMTLVLSGTAATAAMASSSHALPSEQFMEPLQGSIVPGSEGFSWYSNMRPPSFSTILPAARSDPFNTLPIELSQESKMLLDHFTNNRILLQKMVESKRDPELFRFATSDPALMHGALVLSANSRANLCRDEKTHLELILYQHKTETIRLVNERLGNRRVATSDGTVGAIACLVILEALNGAAQIARVHLSGLKQLIDLRGDLHSPTMNRYLQRIVMIGDLLTSSATQTTPIFQQSPPPEGKEMKVPVSTATVAGGNLDYIEKELGLDSEISSMFVELHCVSYLMEQNDNGTLQLEKVDLHRSIYETENSVDTLMRVGVYDARTVNGVQTNSGCCTIAAYIYVYRSLRRIPYSSTLYDYMVRILKEDIDNVSGTVREVFPKEVLFWVFFVGASAGKGRPEESYFRKVLAVSRQVLSITTWEVAKFVLKKFAWVEGWNEEVDKELFNGLQELDKNMSPV